ncbi:pyridoxal phosphate-dependent aminotransferase [Actinoallomurus iriomotensis]|nr:pyridoxal phosphate-dependent aminotransferase [Actinoallomurus iriomotensis]
MAVSARAAELRAAGRKVISFAAGEPDFPTPAHIVEAAARASADPRFHRYTPSGGLPELREAIAAGIGSWASEPATSANVAVTNGAKHAVFLACAVLLNPGDEVLLARPYWTTYPDAIKLNGGVPVFIATDEKADYKLDVASLDAALTPRTRAVILGSPGNPTGSVYEPDELRLLAEWADRRGLWVISDEIYDHLVYGDASFVSVPDCYPAIADRCLLINGVSKTYAMTGWRVGWLAGPKDAIRAAINVISHMTSNVANVAQAAALEALVGDQREVDVMRHAFDRRRRTMVDALSGIWGVSCPEPRGAFYCWPDVSAILGHRVVGVDVDTASDLAQVLLDYAQVAVIPGEAFGSPTHLRLSYALSDEDLVEGLSGLHRVLSDVNRPHSHVH